MVCSSTSPMASSSCSLLTKPSSLSLSSRNSLFLAANAVPLAAKRRLRLVASRRGGGALGCRCLFGLGVPELVVIAGVAALVFGPKQLPEIGRSIGKTVKSFQQAAKEFETELKKDPDDASQPPLSETTEAVSGEDEKKEVEASGTKESI
ncbi:sec-independent protein translocase protein TATA, chloroplastic-like [Typha angustifolia]|uniref:sec-independent protein translocase protein TATA, chloroplastic-like n=1 Tax=Typha angustifolia TaxID=59011 RepID=UPI003C2F603D